MMIYLLIGLMLWVVFDMVGLLFHRRTRTWARVFAAFMIVALTKGAVVLIEAHSLFWGALIIYCIVLLTKGVKSIRQMKDIL